MQIENKKQILLVGNPNVGKSTVFNQLCNKKQKTGNYAGVTVAAHSGRYIHNNKTIEIVDLPGSYSIYPSSEDEAIFSKYLIDEASQYDGVIYILEALSIKRGLLLFRQIQDLGIPVLVILNQIDQAEKRGIKINVEILEKEIGAKVISTNAKSGIGIEDIKNAIDNNLFSISNQPSFQIPTEHQGLVFKILSDSKEENQYKIWTLLASDTYIAKLETINDQLKEDDAVKCLVPKRLQTQETIRRYQTIDKTIAKAIVKKTDFKILLTEKLDKVLVHKFWGYAIFVLILLLIFQMVYYLASYPMDWISNFFLWFSGFSHDNLPSGPINSLISNGIIPGIGGIVVFAPQIGILLYLLYLLEDSGYMARVVFLMDRLLRPFGLSGKSIVPLISGTACAIPAIMSTRNIENVKERLITILVTPFMTCSARLPVYSIIIELVIPDKTILGISYKAIALLGMYFVGFLSALLSSLVLKKIIKNVGKTFLVMDLPTYKKPLFGYDFKMVLLKVWEFVTGAGKIIFLVSIIIWVFSYFGPSKTPGKWIATDVKLQQSYLAKMGHKIEPAIAPLGFDWKMGVGIITSFAAREVFVGTMATLYSLDDTAPEGTIIEKMKNDVLPNGQRVFSFATGISILMYYAFAMQCISTIAVVYRETKSLKWTLAQLFAMSGLAYIVSFVVYQLFR
ncbi:MAG: ferrous iron transport protein B [Bacteroidetes bacterium]|nr:ferrous iron transport protein B [Bacteroidota bacterium]